MGRNLSLLFITFVTQFLKVLAFGIGFTAIMLPESVYSVGSYIWEQSNNVADKFIQNVGEFRMDSRFNTPMFAVIRLIWVILMVISTLFLSKIVLWIFGF
jgi:hypothetical protein